MTLDPDQAGPPPAPEFHMGFLTERSLGTSSGLAYRL